MLREDSGRRTAVALVACTSAAALFAPAAGAVDVYAYANGCYALRDATANRFVVRDSLGYTTSATTAAAATPFRLKATALGRYLLFGPDGRMPAAAPLNTVTSTTTPGTAGRLERRRTPAATLRLTSVSTGKQLGVGTLGRLNQVASAAGRWTLVARQGARSSPRSR